MKKNIIIYILLSFVCSLIDCTAKPATQTPTLESTSSISVQLTEIPISELIVHSNETTAEYDDVIYIGNKNTKKFHNPDCLTLPMEKNRVEFTSRTKAINAGYSPCGNCRP